MALTPEQIDLIANKYLVGLFQEMEQDVISDIVRRIRKTERITETAELMAQSMANQGFSPAEIYTQVMQGLNADPQLQAMIAKNTLEYKKEVTERIDELVEEAKEAGDDLVANAGRMCFNDDLSLWREAGKELGNTALPQIIEAIQAQTQEAMRNLTQTTALALRDATGVPINVMDGYKRILDKTTLQVATGNFSANEAINNVVKEMAKSGVRFVEYNKNGKPIMTELDVATRRAVRTGVSQMAGRIMEENIRNSDTDLVITSQHMGSRPEHAEWQNKIFSFSGKSKRYKSLADGTGYGTVTGLKGANCSHNFYPYWPGVSVREPDIKEPLPVEINGKQYTYYQATQKQREYERKLRSAKREIAIQEQSGGNPDDIARMKRETRALSKEYYSFSNKAGLRPKPERARVAGVGIGNNSDFTPSSPTMFKHALTNAKTSCPDSIRWRVDDYSHSVIDYADDILLISPGGSTVAITPTGDIISVCKNQNDPNTRGKQLIEEAVKNGGVKLDSFSGNHEFYVKCGFEPVSWCEFDEQYAPPGWVKGRDEPEPIIFYKYTGEKSQYTTASSFLDSVKASDDYDMAQSIRDNAIGGGK